MLSIRVHFLSDHCACNALFFSTCSSIVSLCIISLHSLKLAFGEGKPINSDLASIRFAPTGGLFFGRARYLVLDIALWIEFRLRVANS